MTPVLIFALAAASEPPPAPAAPVDVRKIDFDLRLYTPSVPPDCGDPAAAEILVCGRRPGNAYPLDKMAKVFESGPVDAETGLIGNVRGAAYVQHKVFSNGMETNRIMLGIKLPF